MAIQVKEATKDGQGNPLPVLGRQFISFSYGGKKIEDFNLLAVFSGDRLSKNAYSEFRDVTTKQDELDGQYFWLSSYDANSLSFNLATDGITARELEDFKAWFVPGIERELILTELNNRGILARVSSAPSYSLLPFEEEMSIEVNGVKKNFRTSLYKGEVSLTFTMDDPHWYSLKDYISGDIGELEAKIIYEDGIPHTSMLTLNCILAGKNYFANGAIQSNTGVNINPLEQEDAYLYYCGTTEAKPVISFTLSPKIDTATRKVQFEKSGSNAYYYLKIGKNEMRFGEPEIMTAYNSAIDIVKEIGKTGNSILDLRAEMRDELYDYYIRAWSMKIIDDCRNDVDHNYVSVDGAIKAGFMEYFINTLSAIWERSTLTFSINSKNGEATVSGSVNGIIINEKCGNMMKSQYIKIGENKIYNEQGKIGTQECLAVISNVPMTNLIIDYKYMYL